MRQVPLCSVYCCQALCILRTVPAKLLMKGDTTAAFCGSSFTPIAPAKPTTHEGKFSCHRESMHPTG